MSYWYNVDTGTVQSDAERGQNANVLGPYETAEEASRALETAREKTDRWDEEERQWEEKGSTWAADD